MKKFKDITIKHATNGVKVKVGCWELVYSQDNLKQFFTDVREYFKDPEKKEEEMRKRWKVEKEGNNWGGTYTFTNTGLVAVEDSK